MANFRTHFTSGVVLKPWTDPDSVSSAGRLNPQAEHAHKRIVGTVGVQVELTARVGGVEAPLDGALGGNLFTASFDETPSVSLPVISSPGGQSSVQRFTPNVVGHYTLRMLRPSGGAIIHHIDVDS
jgi:hypothetical protein